MQKKVITSHVHTERVRPYVHCIWSQTSLCRNTSTIFVRIWSSRCVIYHLNGHTLSYKTHLTILLATKRGCHRTDVNFGKTEKKPPKQTARSAERITTTENNKIRLFQAFKFSLYSFLYSHCIGVSHCWLLLSMRPEQHKIFVYVPTLFIFLSLSLNDIHELFLILIRAMDLATTFSIAQVP